jgi:hypothetical protein
LARDFNSCMIMPFINLLGQIFDCTNVVTDFNVDVHIVFGRQIDIMRRYHPTIVQFNAMNQHILHFCKRCAIEVVVQNERLLPSQLASLNGNHYYSSHSLGESMLSAFTFTLESMHYEPRWRFVFPIGG